MIYVELALLLSLEEYVYEKDVKSAVYTLTLLDFLSTFAAFNLPLNIVVNTCLSYIFLLSSKISMNTGELIKWRVLDEKNQLIPPPPLANKVCKVCHKIYSFKGRTACVQEDNKSARIRKNVEN